MCDTTLKTKDQTGNRKRPGPMIGTSLTVDRVFLINFTVCRNRNPLVQLQAKQSKQIIQVLPINQHQKLKSSSSLSVSYCNLSQMHLRHLQPEATFRRQPLKTGATKNGSY